MKCPYCAAEFESGSICPSCGADVSLNSKIVNISDSYYNAGLSMAYNSDLTGAVNCLIKSLTFNKNNMPARNLLGLVYYEIGRIGDALKQWRISASLCPGENPAAEYIQQLEKNSRQFIRLNDAVNMYNTALDYVRQKSDDMAIIQLKKAVDTNPGFVDALNLLSLSYLIQGENLKAAGIIEKTLSIDTNNPLALHYYKQVFAEKTRPTPLARAVKSPAAIPARPVKTAAAPPEPKRPASGETGFGRSFPIAGIISFIIGVLCAFAILYILIIPEQNTEMSKKIDQLQSEHAAQVEGLQKRIDDADLQYTQLQETIKAEKEKSAALEAQVTLDAQKASIVNAERFVDKTQYQDAIDAAATIDKNALPPDLQERLQIVFNTSYPKVVEQHYNSGVKLYNARQYDDARVEFEYAMKYTRKGDDLGDDVLYYLGRIAANANDKDTAKDYFQRILDDYPDGNQVSNATNRLRSLG